MTRNSGAPGPRRPWYTSAKVLTGVVVPLLVAVIGLIAAIIPVLFPASTGSAATSAATSAPLSAVSSTLAVPARSPSPSASRSRPQPWNHGTLTLSLGMNANLESRNPDFDQSPSMNWPPGDVAYDKSSNGAPGYTLFLADAPVTTAVLHSAGPLDYATCLSASYGGESNTPWQSNIASGHALCFHPSRSWYILLEVISQDTKQITLEVSSWTTQ